MIKLHNSSISKFTMALLTSYISGCSSDNTTNLEVDAVAPDIIVNAQHEIAQLGRLTVTAQISDNKGIASVEWNQTDGPELIVLSTNNQQLVLQAPQVEVVETVVFKVTATDLSDNIAEAEFHVSVQPEMYSSEEIVYTFNSELDRNKVFFTNVDGSPENEIVTYVRNDDTVSINVFKLQQNLKLEKSYSYERAINHEDVYTEDFLNLNYDQIIISSGNYSEDIELIDLSANETSVVNISNPEGRDYLQQAIDINGDGVNEILFHVDLDDEVNACQLNKETFTIEDCFLLKQGESENEYPGFQPYSGYSLTIDLNNDGKLDVVEQKAVREGVECCGPYDTYIKVSLQQDNFEFEEIARINESNIEPRVSIHSIVDLNNDSLPDIVMKKGSEYLVYNNNGTAEENFKLAQSVDGELCIRPQILDMDYDGVNDILCFNWDREKETSWFNIKDEESQYLLTENPLNSDGITKVEKENSPRLSYDSLREVFDIDGDGDKDLLFWDYDYNVLDQIASFALINKGNGLINGQEFLLGISDSYGNYLRGLVLTKYADLDADGDLELIEITTNANENGENVSTVFVKKNLLVN